MASWQRQDNILAAIPPRSDRQHAARLLVKYLAHDPIQSDRIMG
jgi:hypothetical protein